MNQHLIFLIICSTFASVSWSQTTKPTTARALQPGERIPLTDGPLFIPESIKPGDDKPVDLVIHLHGASWAAENSLVASKLHGAVVSIVLNGLSKVYNDKFNDPAVFGKIVDEAQAKLKEKGFKPGRVILTSFSAGFGGVRRILESDDYVKRIDVLILADSLHTGFKAAPREVDDKPLAPFLKFAELAAAGEKTMIVSHSQIQPGNYAGTTETADYLIKQLGMTRERSPAQWAQQMRRLTVAQKGKLTILGFEGETGPDHMHHLHEIWRLMELIDKPMK